MARKRNEEENPDENQEVWPGDDERDDPRDEHDAADGAEYDAEHDAEAAADGEASDAEDGERQDAALPTESDLEERGFTPDEVQRLVVVSDRQAQSDESQVAEATLRRMRFTRWLIDHGMLNEWSA